MKKIALFPLKNVLFPGTMLALHIFEERYKILINENLNGEMDFGINLKDVGKVHDIGCLCSVSEIIKKYDDGRMDVLIEGKNKYKITERDSSEIGYYTANIKLIDEKVEDFDDELLEKCVSYYNELIEHIKTIKINKINLDNFKTKNPSYQIAQKSGLSLQQKYDLLILNSENERLEYLLNHLSKIFPIIKEAEVVSRIVKNDGYYIPNL